MNTDYSPNRPRNPPQTCKAIKSQLFKPSKQSPSKKISPANAQKNCYEKTCCGHLTRTHFNSFLLDLQTEIKKIDGSITLSFDEKSVLSSVLLAVRQSVDYIFLVQNSFSHTDRADLENFKSNLKIQEAKLKNEAEKLKITARHLEQYDLMLKNKEEQVKSEEKKYALKLDSLKQEDLLNEELKLRCIQLEQEVRLLKRQKISVKEGAEESFLADLETLRKENQKLKEILYSKNSLDSLDNQRTVDQLMLNKEKYKLEHVKLELAQLKLTIEKEKSKIRPNETLHLEDSINLSATSEKNVNFKAQELDYRECLLIQSEKELKKSIELIQEQIEIYSKELEKKESELEELVNQIRVREKVVNKKFLDLKLIEESLIVSKSEIDEFNTLVLPSFEDYSQAVSQLLADLYSKKQEILDLAEKLYKLEETLEIQETCINEELEINKNEQELMIDQLKEKEEYLERLEKQLLDKETNLNEEFNERITVISEELEEKLKSVKEKEKELEEMRDKLEYDRNENEKIAIKLKMTHLEMENSKIKQMEKFRVKKERLKELKEKWEEQLKAGNKGIEDKKV